MSRLNIIVAAADNMVIGKDNDLPWRLPSDLKHFKHVTEGNKVVMGRKCWESIPEKFRPLPNRKNIVVTRDTSYVAAGAKVRHDLEELIIALKEDGKQQDVYIIGGAEIYEKALPYCDRVFLTLIHAEVEGNVYFTGFNKNEWDVAEVTEIISENGYDFNFYLYTRKCKCM